MTSPEQLGPYRLLEKIGQGGMGAVYSAVHIESDTRAAVKILSEGLSSQEGFRDRFQVEIETLKKLRHPNIVSLYGYGEQDGLLFYAMELVDGKSLQELLEEGRRFNWKAVTQFGINICQALKHAQDHGVVHRDLKPANLLLANDADAVKLSDFGIAKLFGAAQMTVDGGVIGTIHYMSPEQAAGQRVTVRSDLYSLGAVLYTLLARRPPFVSAQPADVLHALKYDSPAPVSHHAHGTPPELERIIMQLLEKDPIKRIATPLAAANRLQAMLIALQDQPDNSDFFSQPTAEDGTIEASPSELGIGAPHASPTRTLDNHLAPSDSAASPATSSPDSAPPTTSGDASHYTEVPSRERTPPIAEDDSTPAWLTAAMILVGIIGVGSVLYFVTRPPSADKLYSEIAAAKQDPDKLAETDHVIDDFLSRFPGDERVAEVSRLKKQIKRQRMQRQFERRARRVRDIEQLEPIERAYLTILRVMAEDPEEALKLTEALLQLYEVDPPRGERVHDCLELVRIQKEELQQRVRSLKISELAALRARLEAIERIKEKSPAQAAKMYRSLITLYHDRSWARPLVEQAEQALEELAPETTPK